MKKDTNYYGIDISKDVFDVMDEKSVHNQFKNNHSGYKKFLKYLDKHSHCVMEATVYYHYKLAYYLLENQILVSVENPLSVKRFIQMKLSKTKTDKSDAKMICAS
ncbi:MAG: transposase [Patiriisocius sp.]|jgi:transposase